jgi:hypothetical protein
MLVAGVVSAGPPWFRSEVAVLRIRIGQNKLPVRPSKLTTAINTSAFSVALAELSSSSLSC